MTGSKTPPLIARATALVAAEARPVIRRSVRSLQLYIVAGVLLLVAFTAAIVALALALGAYFGAIGSAMLMSVCTLAAAMLLISAARFVNRRERRREREARAARGSLAALTRALLSELTPRGLGIAAGLGALALLLSGTTSGRDGH